MRFTIFSLFVLLLFSCDKKAQESTPRIISQVKIETLLQDSLLNVRALEVIENRGAFATDKGEVGFIFLSEYFDLDYEYHKEIVAEINYTVNFKKDSALNFRTLAVQGDNYFALSIGSPAIMVKIPYDSTSPFVYKETHPKAFYDSMDFWNDHEGIAIGDPTDGCMSIIITRDGGNTWHKIPCENLPRAVEGEAAFAASDTNIAIVGNNTWVATGGKASRVIYSPDKGKTWQVFDTPIVQGKATTGMYSIDFYDEKHGFAIGGDYTQPDDNTANKIRTQDGGKTWQLVAKNKNPGYRSCVQYVPNSKAKELVAVGFKGIDFSNDAGKTWKHLSDEGFYTIRFVNDSVAYAAGQGRVAKLIFR